MEKVLLCILDGLGINALDPRISKYSSMLTQQNIPNTSNHSPHSHDQHDTNHTYNSKHYDAFFAAHTPNLDQLITHNLLGLLEASGEYVGLPPTQMGNSEVGHMTIGCGKAIKQELSRISEALESGDLAHNPSLTKLLNYHHQQQDISQPSTCHIIGLLSDGGIHSHIKHIQALANFLLQRNIQIQIHVIADGRDAPPRSLSQFLDNLKQETSTHNHAHNHAPHIPNLQPYVSTIIGRFYAMDRDKRWERTQNAIDLIFNAKSNKTFENISDYISNIYEKDFQNTDEYLDATKQHNYSGIKLGDTLLMCNFRADRAKQFMEKAIELNQCAIIATMSPYAQQIDRHSIQLFPKIPISNTLGEIIANSGKKQLRIAETEKYAHVTFFFNGGHEEIFEGEDRILIPSPLVKSYDMQPEMSAPQLTTSLIKAMSENKYHFICANYANADMVGHTGNFKAAVLACEFLDKCIGDIIKAAIKHNYSVIITADHGNIEKMFDNNTQQTHTAHTTNPVPLIFVDNQSVLKKINIKQQKFHNLQDIAILIRTALNI